MGNSREEEADGAAANAIRGWISGDPGTGFTASSRGTGQEEEEAAAATREEEEGGRGSRRCLRQHVLGAWTKAKEIYCFAPCIYGISALRPIYIPSDGAARNARTAIPNNCFWKCERASLLTTLLSLSFSASPSFFFGEASVRIEVDRTVYRRQTGKMLVRGSSYAMTPSFSPLKSRLHPYFSPYFSLVRPLHLPKDDKSSRRNV